MSLNFLGSIDDNLISEALDQWPADDWRGWHRYTGRMGEKLASKPGSLIPSACIDVLGAMQCMCEGMIGESFVDTSLHGAGLHWILPGGMLPRHLDSERHPSKKWVRTHSIVCFMDDHPDDGALVVLDGLMSVSPKRGLVVMFPTCLNWHWVNKTETDRKTLALFCWKNSKGLEFGSMSSSATWS